jgi:precorrin-3B methylase
MDIVERLRREEDALDDEAADEIERLREALKNAGDALEIAFNYDGDVFRKKHNDATDALIEARAALKGDK